MIVDDEECDVHEDKAILQRAFGEILCLLQKLASSVNRKPYKILQYTELYKKHKMSSKNLLITDVPRKVEFNICHDYSGMGEEEVIKCNGNNLS